MSKSKISNNGRVFVISGPAGAGKTTLVTMLVNEFPEKCAESISCTTRAPRGDEKHREHYHFVDRKEFEAQREKGLFIEWAEVFGELYGTLKSEVKGICDSGKDAFLVIDVQGAQQLMSSIEATFIFIAPPSMDELKRRMLLREADSDEEIKKRLSFAKEELEKSKLFDYTLCNDDLDAAYAEFKNFVMRNP